jgi:beta-glucosidase
MRTQRLFNFTALLILVSTFYSTSPLMEIKPFQPPVSYQEADRRADSILKLMTMEEKISFIGGYNSFYIKGFEKYHMPSLYLSDATQGVHLRKQLSKGLEKSTAFPSPLALAATWNPDLAQEYARSVGEECRAGDIAVLLGPGMNIYRISQNSRNFEYFGEDPYLAARIIENYVVGVQSTGTVATLKHFLCNNTEYYRRTSNVIVDERTLHEIYLPAFKAGIDAGAMAIMTSYNQVNGEWAGQSQYVIADLLRKQLNFKWLVMTDWWSVWDPAKTIKSGLDLEMPGNPSNHPYMQKIGDVTVKTNVQKLLNEGKVTEQDINRMAKSIMRTCIAMGFYDRPVKDTTYLEKYPEHEKKALQTAREAIVMLKNDKNILPLKKNSGKKILLTGSYVEKIAGGHGAAQVEGYNKVTMLDALTREFSDQLEFISAPTDDQIKTAGVILLSVGTEDSEGWDKPFEQPDIEKTVLNIAGKNPNVVVILNTGAGIQMTNWNNKVSGIIYAWYVGQNGNTALAEILAGKTNPSGKLPITIEKKFEDSPGFSYIPAGQKLYSGWYEDMNMSHPINNIEYKEGVFIGYRWYESKNIQPLYHFGYGLSYSTFEYRDIKSSAKNFTKEAGVTIEIKVKNTGKYAGAEVAQLYIQELKPSVARPLKELKGFSKVMLNPGETKTVTIKLSEKDFAFWDVNQHNWKAEPGAYKIMIGAASNDIRQTIEVVMK